VLLDGPSAGRAGIDDELSRCHSGERFGRKLGA
jgi:hypothetical protein